MADPGDKGKAPTTEPSAQGDSDDDTIPPPRPIIAGMGAPGAGSSGASSSYTVPNVPQDIMYYEGGLQVPYRVPTNPVRPDLFGSLSGVPPETVSLFMSFFHIDILVFPWDNNLCSCFSCSWVLSE